MLVAATAVGVVTILAVLLIVLALVYYLVSAYDPELMARYGPLYLQGLWTTISLVLICFVVGALVYAVATDFTPIGIGRLVVLGLLAVAGAVLAHVAAALGVRGAGGSRRAMVGALVGAILGLAAAPAGLLLGPLLGAIVAELVRTHRLATSVRSGVGAVVGQVHHDGLRLADGQRVAQLRQLVAQRVERVHRAVVRCHQVDVKAHECRLRVHDVKADGAGCHPCPWQIQVARVRSRRHAGGCDLVCNVLQRGADGQHDGLYPIRGGAKPSSCSSRLMSLS